MNIKFPVYHFFDYYIFYTSYDFWRLFLILISYENIGYELQDVKMVEARKCTPTFSLYNNMVYYFMYSILFQKVNNILSFH